MPAGPPERASLLQHTAIAVGAALLLFCLASMFRYEIAPATPLTGINRLDRWTGHVQYCPIIAGAGVAC